VEIKPGCGPPRTDGRTHLAATVDGKRRHRADGDDPRESGRSQRRVAITGLVRDPARERRRRHLARPPGGAYGVAPITQFDAGGFPVRIAAEVKEFDPGTRSKTASSRPPTAPRHGSPRPRRLCAMPGSGRGAAMRRAGPVWWEAASGAWGSTS
jgi:hypothetical protein